MKIIANNFFITLIVLIVITLSIGKISIMLSDNFQKKICVDKICMGKPKGWLPLFVDRGENLYLFNMIPFSVSDEEEVRYGMILLGSSGFISIYQSKFKPSEKLDKYFDNFDYMSKKYYVEKGEKNNNITVYCPESNLSIILPHLDKNVLNEICNFRTEKN